MVGNGRHCSHIIKVHKSLANISNTLIETFYVFLLSSPRSQPTQFLGWFLTFWGTAACHPARPCGNRRGCGTPDPADLWQVLNQSYSQQPRWACRGWGESSEESCTTGAPSKVTEPFQCCLKHSVPSCLSLCSAVGVWQGSGWDPRGRCAWFRLQTLQTNSVLCNHPSKLSCSWKLVLVHALIFVLRDSLQCIPH